MNRNRLTTFGLACAAFLILLNLNSCTKCSPKQTDSAGENDQPVGTEQNGGEVTDPQGMGGGSDADMDMPEEKTDGGGEGSGE